MAPEVPQRVEAVSLDAGQRLPDNLLHPTAFPSRRELSDNAGYRLGLSGLGELLHICKLYSLATELYGVKALAPRRLSLAAP